jgi:hypothetical protein
MSTRLCANFLIKGTDSVRAVKNIVEITMSPPGNSREFKKYFKIVISPTEQPARKRVNPIITRQAGENGVEFLGPIFNMSPSNLV